MWDLTCLALWEQWQNVPSSSTFLTAGKTLPPRHCLKLIFFLSCVSTSWRSVCLGNGELAENGLGEMAVCVMGQGDAGEAQWWARARGTCDFQKTLGHFICCDHFPSLVGKEGLRWRGAHKLQGWSSHLSEAPSLFLSQTSPLCSLLFCLKPLILSIQMGTPEKVALGFGQTTYSVILDKCWPHNPS